MNYGIAFKKARKMEKVLTTLTTTMIVVTIIAALLIWGIIKSNKGR